MELWCCFLSRIGTERYRTGNEKACYEKAFYSSLLGFLERRAENDSVAASKSSIGSTISISKEPRSSEKATQRVHA
jgi:hypothetical protein